MTRDLAEVIEEVVEETVTVPVTTVVDPTVAEALPHSTTTPGTSSSTTSALPAAAAVEVAPSGTASIVAVTAATRIRLGRDDMPGSGKNGCDVLMTRISLVSEQAQCGGNG